MVFASKIMKISTYYFRTGNDTIKEEVFHPFGAKDAQ